MIRTTIIPKQTLINLTLSIPEEYIDKELYLIIYSKDEGLQDSNDFKKNVTFDAVSIDTQGFKFDRDEANR